MSIENLPDFMSFECFFLFESREKTAGSNIEHKKERERAEQIKVERKEIKHSADKAALH